MSDSVVFCVCSEHVTVDLSGTIWPHRLIASCLFQL